MVDRQIAARGITDERVLAAMRRVERHRFVPADVSSSAYEDHPIQIGHGQTISQPYMVAIMTELLRLKPTDRVLEIGTGSGYQTAILAEVAGEIVTIERNPHLAEGARSLLKQLGYAKVTVVVADGTLGFPEQAPYDAILVTAGSPRVPQSLQQQLIVGGRLVCPVGPREMQQLAMVTRTQSGFHEDTGLSCMFVPLVGEEGWKEP